MTRKLMTMHKALYLRDDLDRVYVTLAIKLIDTKPR